MTKKAIVQRLVDEVWNKGDLSLIEDLFVERCKVNGRYVTLEGLKERDARARESFPDAEYNVDDLIAAGDKVIIRWQARGAHKGTLWGIIPPTGKNVIWRGMHIFHFENGKISEMWSIADNLGKVRQLGVPIRPPPGVK